MKQYILIGLILSLILISGCVENSNYNNVCVDRCMDLRCNMYDKSIAQDPTLTGSCRIDRWVYEQFEESCKKDCKR